MHGPHSSLSASLTKHTVIIGSGVSGLSAAWALLQQGDRVTLIEHGSPSRESSWAGGGILSPLLPWQYTAPVTDLALAAMRAYGRWIAHLESNSGLDTEYLVCGMQIFNSADAQDEALDWCKRENFRVSVILSQEGESLWLPDIAQIRNPRLSAALRTAITSNAGTIKTHCSILGMESQSQRITQLATTHGTVCADRFVIATGAWAGLPLAGLEAVPNIRPIRGQMLLFRKAPGLLDRILYCRGLYLIPRQDGHILVGSTLENAGFNKSTDQETFRYLEEAAASLLPALRGNPPVQHWAGLRPGSPDNIPVIDRHPAWDNVYINAGHYRYGVTMAPAAAELLADLMEGKPPALDPTPYSWAAAQGRKWGDSL